MPGLAKMARQRIKVNPKKYKGKSTKPGGGGKFAMMIDELMMKGMSKEMAKAVVAKAGMKKYGKAKMSKMAAAGKKRAARKKK